MKIVPNSVDVFQLEDFFYGLFDGGYINPSEICEEPADADCVLEAIQIIEDFRRSMEMAVE